MVLMQAVCGLRGETTAANLERSAPEDGSSLFSKARRVAASASGEKLCRSISLGPASVGVKLSKVVVEALIVIPRMLSRHQTQDLICIGVELTREEWANVLSVLVVNEWWAPMLMTGKRRYVIAPKPSPFRFKR